MKTLSQFVRPATSRLCPSIRKAQLTLLLLVLALLSRPLAEAQTFPTGFSQALVTNGLSNPTVLAFAPDGRIFVGQQSGALRVIKNGSLLPAPFVSLSVNSSGERGLIGITLDPNFSTNNYLYLYYTVPTGTIHNRISRFTASGDVAAAGSEVVLLDLDPLSSATNHNGGAMHFGADGKLYVAIGENANGANAQNLDTYHGKVLRINPDGSVPGGNPFVGAGLSAQRQRVWSYGLRNPYTFAVQPGTGRIFLNDVGQNTWEEINDASTGGRNYGWPATEGATTAAGVTGPVFSYPHGSGDGKGCAITGGTFFNPASTNYPAAYLGKYFYQDLCNQWINYLDLSGSPAVRFPFATSLPGNAVGLETGLDGNLYYLSRSNGALYKVVYTAATSAPVITTQPANVTVAPGVAAVFSVTAAGTAPLSYQWQKNGVNISGATASSYTIASAAIADAGQYRVVVSNSVGAATSNAATLTVTVPNTAPTAQISTPTSGTTYVAGTTISFSGDATDAEDGPLPASAFSWRVDFHHGTHVHDGTPFNQGAKTGTFLIPNTGETAANVFYRLILTVTDAAGLQTTTSRDISPQTSTITLATSPAGLQLTLDGQPQSAPVSVVSVEGVLRTLGVISPQTVGGVTYEFVSWSQGGAATQTVTTPTADATYTATFRTALRPAENPANTTAGLDFTYYEGSGWSTLPNFAALTPARTGTTPDFTLAPRLRNDDFAFRYTGYVQVPTDGTYTFYTNSDDGSQLFIGSTLVVNNDGLHGTQERSGQIGLKAGVHAISVTFFERGGDQMLGVSYAGPGLTKTVVPASALLRPNVAVALRNPDSVANPVAGLSYSYYQGTWDALPNFAALTPVASGTVGTFDLAPRLRDESFGFRYTGYVQVPTDGTYTFYTNSDDGSQLYIGSTLVVNNDGLHPAQETMGNIGLKAGLHAITVTFFEKFGGQVLGVSYAGPGLSKTAVPAAALFRAGVVARPLAQATGAAPASAVRLYPNPARDAVTISLQTTAAQVRVEVYDAVGRRVAGFAQAVRAGQNELLLPLNQLPGGVYSVTVLHGKERSVQRLVVER